MKKLLIISTILMASLTMMGQDDKSSNEGVKIQNKSDRFMWGIHTDLWQDASDSIGIESVNQGMSFQGMLDFPFSTKLSIAVGLGLASHNLYSSSWLMPVRDSLSRLTDKSAFYNIPTDSVSYKNNKVNVTYLEIPVEFRFRSNSSEGVKIALGFKAGLTINNHTKYKGDEYIYMDGKTIKEKVHNNEHILNYRYGATARIGYKWINLNVFYSLTNLFKDNKGPEMYPISVGFIITPF